MSRLASFASLVALVASGTACRSRNGDEGAPPANTARPVAVAAAVDSGPRDHLAPGELVEGKVSAFGITFPRGFTLRAGFNDMAIAEGPAKPADVANYLRARVPARSAMVGAASTIFDHVQTEPGRELVVKVEPMPVGQGTLITVRDVSPPPPDGLTVDQRWQEAGLTPTGRIADPTHLH